MEGNPDLKWDSSEYSDEFDYQCGWDGMVERLTEFIQKVHPDGDWYCKVENFGWRNIDGHQEFSAGDGAALLSAMLPRTECTFSIWLDEKEKKITINNAHHDKPCGNEMYFIRPAQEDDT